VTRKCRTILATTPKSVSADYTTFLSRGKQSEVSHVLGTTPEDEDDEFSLALVIF
jgi:hypothetical protein